MIYTAIILCYYIFYGKQTLVYDIGHQLQPQLEQCFAFVPTHEFIQSNLDVTLSNETEFQLMKHNP